MVGGRRPGDTGTFTAGFEPLCSNCAEMAANDPTEPPLAPMTPTQLDALVPDEIKRSEPKSPTSVHIQTQAPIVPDRPRPRPRKATHRRRSGRFVARHRPDGSPAVFMVVGAIVLVGILIIALAAR
jgi:hypothetical protein